MQGTVVPEHGGGARHMAEAQKDRCCGHWGAFVSYLWDSLNKKEGFGVGLQVLLVTESAAGHFLPP